MIKKYYLMDHLIDKKITGDECPQCNNFVKGTKPDAPDSFYETWELWVKRKFPAFTPKLDGLKLSWRAKFTDFMSNLSLMPLLSEKAKILFSQYNLGEHKFYPGKIFVKNEEIQCYFLYTIAINMVDINLEKCKFRVRERKSFIPKTDLISGIKTEDEFKSKQQLTISIDKNNRFYLEELVLKKSFNLDYFVIRTPMIFCDHLVSERLYHAIKDNGLTGLRVEREIFIRTPD